MTRITLDTNVLPGYEIDDLCQGLDVEVRRVSVSDRELSSSSIQVDETVGLISEALLIEESPVGVAAIGGDESAIELVLDIISNGSFPEARGDLTPGQRRQLRDAMIFCNHIQSGGDILVSDDRRAFVEHGRRGRLEGQFGTKILTLSEFEEWCNAKRQERKSRTDPK